MVRDLANIQFRADLRCELDSRPLTIRSAGRTIVVEVPDVVTGLKLLQLGLPRGSRLKRLHQFKRVLDMLFAAVEVRVAGKSVFAIGHKKGSRVWRFFGIPPFRLRAGNAIAACTVRRIAT